MNRSLANVTAIAVLALATPYANGAGKAVWSPVNCPQTRLAPEVRYPNGETLDPFSAAPAVWQVATTEQNAKATVSPGKDGSRSTLHVQYELVGNPKYEYVALENPLALPPEANGISYLVKRGSTRLLSALRIVDAHGEVFQFRSEERDQPGWHRVYFPMKDGISWGGDNNQRMDPPLKIQALVFDRPAAGVRGKGSFDIADLQWLKLDLSAVSKPVAPGADMRFEVRDKRFGNVYKPGEPVAVRASGTNPITWAVMDYFGQTIAKGGGATTAEVTFTPRKLGYYTIRFEALQGAQLVESREFSFAVAPVQGKVAQGGYLGFCTHFSPSGYPLEAMDLMHRYGFTRFRDEIAWGAVEPEKGKYVMPSWSKDYLDHSKALAMEPLIILDYNNRLYDNGNFPNSPEAIKGFAAFCGALSGMVKGYVNNFEIWNEWIGGCGMDGKTGDHSAEAYGRLLTPAAAAVRKARPDATIVAVGGEYGAECAKNVATMFRVGTAANIDAYSLHPYRYPSAPEMSDLIGDVSRTIAAATKEGAPRHAWVSEIGYPTHTQSNGVDGVTQARLGVRTLAILQTSLTIDKVFWYDFKNDGLDITYNENNFGVVLHQDLNCAPKPAIVAMSVFARMTVGAKPLSLWHDDALWVAKYRRPDGANLNIVWSIGSKRDLVIKGVGVKASNIMGNEVSTAGLSAGEDAIYIVGRGLSVTER